MGSQRNNRVGYFCFMKIDFEFSNNVTKLAFIIYFSYLKEDVSSRESIFLVVTGIREI